MLNLDAYVQNTIEVTLGGIKCKVKEPGLNIYFKIKEIEKDLKKENYHEKRLDVALLLLNNNEERHVFTREELEAVPFEGIAEVVDVISNLRLKAESDPN